MSIVIAFCFLDPQATFLINQAMCKILHAWLNQESPRAIHSRHVCMFACTSVYTCAHGGWGATSMLFLSFLRLGLELPREAGCLDYDPPEILLSSFSKHSGFKHRSPFVCLNLGSWAQEFTLVQQAFHWQAFFADCLYNLREFLAWPIWFQNLQQQTSSFLKSLFDFLILHKWCLLSSDQDLAVSSSPWTSPILFYTCTHSAPLQYSTRKWGHAAFISVCLTSLSLKSSRFTSAITSSKPSSFKTESHSLYKYTYHSSSVYLFFSTDILVDSISWILWIMAYKCYQLYSHPHFNLFFFFCFHIC